MVVLLAALAVGWLRGLDRPAPVRRDCGCAGLAREVRAGGVPGWEGRRPRGGPMAKKGRKKRARKKNKANHGNRPNA